MLAGCIIVPYPVLPGALHDSRTNIPEQSPASFVIGQTSRRDVLFELGAPDGADPDERWYSYGSAFGRTGFGLFILGDGIFVGVVDWQSIEFRHLVVGFDDTGVVSSVIFDEKMCTSEREVSAISWGASSTPCLDIRSRVSSDLNEAEASPSDLGPFVVFECSCSHSAVDRESAMLKSRNGSLRIADGAVLYVARPKRRRTYPEKEDRIAITDLESVDMVPLASSRDLPHINLHMTDGRCTGLAFTDLSAPAAVTAFLQERIGPPPEEHASDPEPEPAP